MQRLESPFESIWVKALIIGGLTLLMLWPLARVGSLVSERQELQHQAYEVISAGFGGSQTIGGPILSVDTQDLIVEQSANNTTEVWRAGRPMHLLSDKLRIESDVTVEVRRKGIHSIPVYVSKFVVTGQFAPESIARVLVANAGTRTLPSRAAIQMPLPGVKYLRGLTLFAANGQPLHVTNEDIAGCRRHQQSASRGLDRSGLGYLIRGALRHIAFRGLCAAVRLAPAVRDPLRTNAGHASTRLGGGRQIRVKQLPA